MGWRFPVEEIDANPYQPRTLFDDDAIQELAASIKATGVLQPVIVRRHAGASGYQLVAGERRLRAAKIAGIKKIPAIVKKVDDREMMELSLIENIQRENLNPIEEARAYQYPGREARAHPRPGLRARRQAARVHHEFPAPPRPPGRGPGDGFTWNIERRARPGPAGDREAGRQLVLAARYVAEQGILGAAHGGLRAPQAAAAALAAALAEARRHARVGGPAPAEVRHARGDHAGSQGRQGGVRVLRAGGPGAPASRPGE